IVTAPRQYCRGVTPVLLPALADTGVAHCQYRRFLYSFIPSPAPTHTRTYTHTRIINVRIHVCGCV
ncbi:hypothetical protein, partial [Parabacteroides distasonis]|uniref:hypothetical protein n=1 Tax=Parabacteroides distasonis TaxID=823 RepID=UPI001E2B5EE1